MIKKGPIRKPMTASLLLRAETLRQQRSAYTDLFCLPCFNIGEPCRTFFIQAHSAERIAIEGDLESQKKFLVSLGSNFHISAKRLRFDYEKPWDALARARKNANWRRERDSNPRYGFPYT